MIKRTTDKFYILLSLLIIIGCKSTAFDISYETDSVENKDLTNYLLKADKDFNSKIYLRIYKINEGDHFVLKSSKGDVILDKKLKNQILSGGIPNAYSSKLYRNESYILKINNDKYKIASKDLMKYKYVEIERSRRNTLSYEIVFTNDPRGYK